MVQQTQIIAAIDIGSNSIHMLLAYKKRGQKLAIIKSYKKILTLGRALDENLNIPQNSIDRICTTLEKMKEKAIPYRPFIAIVATHAIRVACNKKELIEIVYKKTKLPIRIISGEEEAYLIGKAISFHFSLQKKTFLGLDIGGGSTEIALYKDNKPLLLKSLQLGSVTLTEKFLKSDKKIITEENISKLYQHVRTELKSTLEELKSFKTNEFIICSGVGKTLASMHYFARTKRKLKNPDKYRITIYTLLYFYKRLNQTKQTKKIQARWKINSNKAEIILAGLIVLIEITEELKIPFWKISNYGIREGLILDLSSQRKTTFNKLMK